MNDIKQTKPFREWREGLTSEDLAQRVRARLARFEFGHLGDVKSVGEGVFEMRIDFGPGIRMYYTRIGKVTYFMLCGGDKSSQVRDIARAHQMAAAIRSAR